MKKLVMGIVAHVDAGKTTLSESMLYLSGKTGKLGRVDNKDAYLDTYELEKARGITIFSKQALFPIADTEITLLDTPGHVDFSAEMERTLQVLDYAILVISGADGVQGHTKTLWELLARYRIPVFLFVNKMDQSGTDKDRLLWELKKQLDDGCIEFEQDKADSFYEQLATCEEGMMESYLETGHIEPEQIQAAVKERNVFPCYFGSALKLEGIEAFMQGMVTYTLEPYNGNEFGAKIFKISRDEQGNRLTHMKLTGGILKVKDSLSNGIWDEKVNQIRMYSGQKFEAVSEALAGTVCAVTGLTKTRPGEGLGSEDASHSPLLEPVLSYRMLFPDNCDPRMMLPKLRQIEEEEPELHIVWDEQLQEILVQIMGEVQIEILQSIIESRFGVKVSFDAGRIVYKETIGNIVEGVGHFEPLRHYAEVHLLLEPDTPGSGLTFGAVCSEDMLSKNWQRLIVTHLEEKVHKGVLLGAPITDMRITVIGGKAHNKHTEGGDFRAATYRAVRQGLKEAESILLEPYYSFQLELPEKMVGRAMTDIEKMYGTSEISQTDGEMVVLTGTAPVITMRNYQKEVLAYTKGLGRLSCTLKGYEPCHNAEEVIESVGYDSESDVGNPTGSVFCAQGAGFLVSWNEVKNHMHVESCLKDTKMEADISTERQNIYTEDRHISMEEIDRILNKTFYANTGKKSDWKRSKSFSERYYDVTYSGNKAEAWNKPETLNKTETLDKTEISNKTEAFNRSGTGRAGTQTGEEYLLVDGYNIVFAWPELKALTEVNMDGARMKLLDSLCNYQAIRKCQIIVVFDAYRVKGNREEIADYHNIHVVYTREAQTADQYIEKFVHDNRGKYTITVATSDGLEQLIVRGAGSSLLSARELKIEMEEANERIKQNYANSQERSRNYLHDVIPSEVKEQVDDD